MKLIPRGDTTVVDAYLSPILRRYVDQVSERLGRRPTPVVHAVERWLDRGPQLPGQGRLAVGSGRGRGRHGPHRRGGRVRQADRVRHGRHLHRRRPLRRRARAHLRDRGGGRSRPGADDPHPHGRRRRWIGAAVRRRTTCGSAPSRPAPTPGRSATATAAPWRSPMPTSCSASSAPSSSRGCSDPTATARSTRQPPEPHSRHLASRVSSETGTPARPRRHWPRASSPSRWRTWPTPSRRSPCNAATTSASTRSSASAAPAASTPAWWPIGSGVTRIHIHPHAGRAVGPRYRTGRHPPCRRCQPSRRRSTRFCSIGSVTPGRPSRRTRRVSSRRQGIDEDARSR